MNMSATQLVEVTVEQGILRGQRIPLQDGGLSYDSFRGIPYAQKPLGPLRFKAPRSPEPWEGVRTALDEGPVAPQLFGGKMVGHEDCLYLNVYTPQVPSSVASRSPDRRPGAPWPIMIWLHPGGFTTGSSSLKEYSPEFLVAEDVVIVTFNYRLGALGFLSLESPTATGNYGLKDMLAAIRWIKRNGGVFGGDVDQITLFGTSAGASATQLLQLSPSAKGLFHRAIATSGSSLHPWASIWNPRARSVRLARHLGVAETDLADDAKMIEFLRNQPVEAILRASVEIVAPEYCTAGLSYMFLPTSEKGLKPDDPEDEIFLPDRPRELIKRGRVTDVPVMMGFAYEEGLILHVTSAMKTIEPVPEVFAQHDKHLEIVLPLELRSAFPDGSKKQKEAVDRIRKVYFNGGAVNEASINGYYNLHSDLLVDIGVLQEARHYARQSTHPVYVFCFAVKGKINRILSRFGEKFDKMPGATHGDELSYLWNTQPPIPALEPDSIEAHTRRRLVSLWTNFAKTGNPTPKGDATLEGINWPPLPKDVKSSIPYLNIGVTLSVQAGLFQERVELWDSLYSELK